jgi:hypothetical protein
MKPEQKIVARGAVSGIVTMALAVRALTTFLPAPSIGDTTAERLRYALVGYRITPLYRAPGFAATAYLNLGMILYALFHLFTGARP